MQIGIDSFVETLSRLRPRARRARRGTRSPTPRGDRTRRPLRRRRLRHRRTPSRGVHRLFARSPSRRRRRAHRRRSASPLQSPSSAPTIQSASSRTSPPSTSSPTAAPRSSSAAAPSSSPIRSSATTPSSTTSSSPRSSTCSSSSATRPASSGRANTAPRSPDKASGRAHCSRSSPSASASAERQQSFVRAGMLGLPLTVAIIGGEPHRFRPLVDLYREAGKRARPRARVPRRRGPRHRLPRRHHTRRPPTPSGPPTPPPSPASAASVAGRQPTRAAFDAQRSEEGAFFVGDPDTVARKMHSVSDALGGVSRITLMMSGGPLPHDKMLRAIDLLGADVGPAVRLASYGQSLRRAIIRIHARKHLHSTQERPLVTA